MQRRRKEQGRCDCRQRRAYSPASLSLPQLMLCCSSRRRRRHRRITLSPPTLLHPLPCSSLTLTLTTTKTTKTSQSPSLRAQQQRRANKREQARAGSENETRRTLTNDSLPQQLLPLVTPDLESVAADAAAASAVAAGNVQHAPLDWHCCCCKCASEPGDWRASGSGCGDGDGGGVLKATTAAQVQANRGARRVASGAEERGREERGRVSERSHCMASDH